MTDLDFKQYSLGPDPEKPWIGMKTYQMTPWPEECTITYYDFGESPIQKGSVTKFNFENGSAEYQALEGGLDVKCKLLPGSTWSPPPRRSDARAS